MLLRKFCQQDTKFNQKFQAIVRVSLNAPSNGEGLRDIQRSMSMVLDTRLYIWLIVSLTKCDRYCYKMWQKFITKCVRFFITKCNSFITKCDSYYKLRQLYYKIRQLLQNVTFITNCDSTSMKYVIVHGVPTKSESFGKLVIVIYVVCS